MNHRKDIVLGKRPQDRLMSDYIKDHRDPSNRHPRIPKMMKSSEKQGFVNI